MWTGIRMVFLTYAGSIALGAISVVMVSLSANISVLAPLSEIHDAVRDALRDCLPAVLHTGVT